MKYDKGMVKKRGIVTMTNFEDFLNEQLKDPKFKAEYDALEPEFAVIQVIMEARVESGLTQKQLSEMTGISRVGISRLERGTANPSVKTLQRVAKALCKKVSIAFV